MRYSLLFFVSTFFLLQSLWALEVRQEGLEEDPMLSAFNGEADTEADSYVPIGM